MGKNQLAKLHKQKPHIINLKPMVVQQLPKDYSNYLLLGGVLLRLSLLFLVGKLRKRMLEYLN
jgi:hypothetical protein